MCVGVYLSLKGVVYPNNSAILITEIGRTNTSQNLPPNSNNGLQCITDRMPCCVSPSRVGEWYFPGGGEVVPPLGGATTFYRNRGDDGTVNLNRLNSSVMMRTGQFCCVVPDAISTNVTVCSKIGDRMRIIIDSTYYCITNIFQFILVSVMVELLQR